jgi:putative ABC transport system permease protein
VGLDDTHATYWDDFSEDFVDMVTWYEPATLELTVPAYVDEVDTLEDLAENADMFGGQITGIEAGAGMMELLREDVMPTYGLDEEFTLLESSTAAMRAELPGLQVDAHRDDYMAWGGEDPIGPIKWVIIGIAGIILLLGALSLLNIALVTIKQRIREIGIRRSFGATTGRVFFSVMMESVVATVVAGVIGVLLAVAAVKNPLVEKYVLQGIDDVPPFPLSAAFLGLAVALAVGTLAGILPAMIAARVKIIDAIRF